jgi:hypothetical protein
VHWALSGIIGTAVAFIPILGQACGAFGAVYGFNVPWPAAVALFAAGGLLLLPIRMLALWMEEREKTAR